MIGVLKLQLQGSTERLVGAVVPEAGGKDWVGMYNLSEGDRLVFEPRIGFAAGRCDVLDKKSGLVKVNLSTDPLELTPGDFFIISNGSRRYIGLTDISDVGISSQPTALVLIAPLRLEIEEMKDEENAQ